MKRPSRKAERVWWEQGHRLVAGIDEVGRGAYAGPVTAAAVILPERCRLGAVRDSKMLDGLSRESASMLIKQQAVAIGLGWASPIEVDQYGLTEAVLRAGQRALADLRSPYDAVLLDGNHNYLKEFARSRSIIKADQSSLCVAAASVIAKVARDNYMQRLALMYPEFGFDSHKGYGAPAHWAALNLLGLSPQHRRRWRPLAGFQDAGLRIQIVD
ncbi:MAG TPA: ribonuclease HII [Candidatus Saccharimonadales bacterium]|nr:ribonuclease HII [Candidatus Saccharimonadales bacterium]